MLCVGPAGRGGSHWAQAEEGSFQLSLFVLQGTAGDETFSLLMCFYSAALNRA